MSIPGSASPLLLASTASAGGYQVSRSLRFNSQNDTSYLTRTNPTAGDTRTWTFSAWIKRSALVNPHGHFIYTGGGAQNTYICFGGGAATGRALDENAICIFSPAYGMHVSTNAVFRDFSAWFHLVVKCDTTQATGTDRVKFYINGVEQATTFTSTPNLNVQTGMNDASAQKLGIDNGNQALFGMMGYMAEVYMIDGQALTPSSFTEVSATTGQLIPKAYGGTFGTNGFWLKFSDNSAATAATLGKDYSGNSNNWTPNNLSVTAGAGNDSLVDTPTSYGTDTGVGGEVRGNYCTLNPLDNGGLTLANGNLDSSESAGSWKSVRSTIGVSSGKWYWELTATSGSFLDAGISKLSEAQTTSNYIGIGANGWGYTYDGKKYNSGTGVAYGAAYTNGDVIGVAFDADNGTLTFFKNGVSQGQAFSGLTSGPYFPAVSNYSSSWVFNAGARPFAYTAPSGFKALCDTNLPSPLIAKPNQYFDVVTYTGTGATQTLPNANSTPSTPLAFSPDFIWTKSRSRVDSHGLHDIVRGRASNLYSDLTAAENTSSLSADLVSFDANGYTLGTVEQTAMNRSGETYVGWAWDAGTSTVSNTQGSITSQVRANVSAGFSVATWSSGSGGTVGHGLGVAPSLIIAKARTGTSQWIVYHSATGVGGYLYLSATSAVGTNIPNVWSPVSSTVFNVNNGLFPTPYDYVSYHFAPVVGYSSFGSYTGNGSADGPFVYTGFRPRWILLKASSASGAWILHDTARTTYNVMGNELRPDDSTAEYAVDRFDLLSNGFKVRSSNATLNTSSATYIYIAFAENPFQYARAR